MKKNIVLAAILMISGIVILGYFTPWWVPPFWIVIIAAWMKLETKYGVLLGGLCFALVWAGMARYMSEQDPSGLIAKTGVLLGGLSHQMMFVAICIISLITGALAGWFGSVAGYFIRTQIGQSAAR